MPPPVAGSISNEGVGRAKGAVSIWKVHAVFAIIQCSYAGSNILSKLAFTGGVNPIVFTVFRDIVGVSCLSPLAFFTERGRHIPLDWRTVGLIVLLGSFGMYAAQMSTSFGQALAPAAYSCLIGISTPIFVFFISAASGLEEVKWTRRSGQAKVGGVLSAVCGGILIPVYNGPVIIYRGTHVIHSSELPLDVNGILQPTFSNLNTGDSILGGFLLILSGFLSAAYWTGQAEVLKRYPAPISIAALSRMIALILMTVTGLVTIRDPSAWGMPRLSDIIAIVYGGVIPYGLTFGLQSWAAFESGPVLLASYKPLQSFATIGVAYIFLGESIHLGSVLGLLCIVNGLFFITWGQVASRNEAEHPVKQLASTLDGVSITEDNSDLERRLLNEWSR